ncbi:TPA: RidA family protein [Candidatus Bathyarchaeota archaeon]|nr:RidA family protein [Candidatus Bathyarchaeota archaeon]
MGGKAVIKAEGAPLPVGPYSQAVKAGGWLFVSGQLPIDPATGEVVRGGAAKQAERALENLKAIVEAAGLSLNNVVKVTLYLQDLKDFQAVNEVYAKYFGREPPARTTVQAAPPKGAKVEIDAVAHG